MTPVLLALWAFCGLLGYRSFLRVAFPANEKMFWPDVIGAVTLLPLLCMAFGPCLPLSFLIHAHSNAGTPKKIIDKLAGRP